MRTSSRLWALSLAVLSFAIAGCGSSSNNPPQSRVRVINASIGANGGQSVDVQLGGQTVFTNVGYGQESGSATVNSGTGVVASALLAGTGTLIVSGPATIQPNVDQTLLVTGVTGGAGALGYQIVALSPQDYSSTPSGGQIRVYFVNAAPVVGTTDFSYTVNGGAVQTNADLTSVNYLQMTPAQLPTFGSTTFTANVAGTIVTSTPITTTGGKTYTVVLTGRNTLGVANPALALQVIQNN
jgi:hypothetical protein